MSDKTLVAFKGKAAVKEKYLARVQRHYDADEITQGIYWENGKGCAVGCTMEQGGDGVHQAMEDTLGIPKELAYLEDRLFEELKNDDAKEFPLRFLKAIKPGADLSLVVAKFVVWQFEDEKYGLSAIEKQINNDEVFGFCKEVVALYKRKVAGDPPTQVEFRELYERIDGAGARAGARAGAWAWARARAGAGAGFDKSYAEYIKAAADKLISLLEEAE